MVRQAQSVVVLLISLFNKALSQCPEVPANGCSICGYGQCVGNPNAIISAPIQLEGFACGQLQAAGYNAEIPLDQCPFFVDYLSVCECGVFSSTHDAPYADAPNAAPLATSPTLLRVLLLTPVVTHDAPFTDEEARQATLPTLLPITLLTPVVINGTAPPTLLPITLLTPVVFKQPVEPSSSPTIEPEFKGKKGGKKGKGNRNGKKKNAGKKNKGKKKETAETLSPVSNITFAPVPITSSPMTTEIPSTVAPITSPGTESPDNSTIARDASINPPVEVGSPVSPPASIPVQPAPFLVF